MDEDKKGSDENDREEEDVIPSSQGEMFSSQSSTPDMLSSSNLIPILQPSQSASEAEMGTPQQPRTSDLLSSTPSEAKPDGPTTPPVVHLDLSCTPSEVHLDLSVSPAAAASPVGSAARKRPLSGDVDSPADKRARPAAADDSDVQIVEEVAPDVQVLFASQEAGVIPAAAAAAAESQAGFRLSLSPTQSDEVTLEPASVQGVLQPEQSVDRHQPAEQTDPSDKESGPVAERSATSTQASVGPTEQTDRPAEDAAPSAPKVAPPAKGAGGALQGASSPSGDLESSALPAAEPTPPVSESVRHSEGVDDSTGSQGFEPPGAAVAAETPAGRLPHIQTPQVGSSSCGESSLGGDTVFGEAQRLIEEQNRRQEQRDEQRPASPPPPKGSQPDLVKEPADESQGDSQAAELSLVDDWRSVMKSSGHATELSDLGGEASGRRGEVSTAAQTSHSSGEARKLPGSAAVTPEAVSDPSGDVSDPRKASGHSWEVSSPGEIPGPLGETSDLREMSDPLGEVSNAGEVSDVSGDVSDLRKVSNAKEVSDPSGKMSDIREVSDPSGEASGIREVSDPSGEASGIREVSDPSGEASDIREVSDPSGEASGLKAVSDPSEGVPNPRKASNASGEVSDRPPDVTAPEPAAEEEEDLEQQETEEPLPAGSVEDDPYRFHATQSQETQPYRLRPALKLSTRVGVSDKSKSTTVSSHAVEQANTSLQRFITRLSSEAKELAQDGFDLVSTEMRLTWRKDGKEIVRDFALNEHDSALFLRRNTSSSLSSNGSSLLSTSTSGGGGGYTADASSSSKSSSGSSRAAKRVSTLSSLTLSTIDGRGARHSISSSVDVLLPGRRPRVSAISVQSCSPGSDGDVEVISASIPEFVSPDGRPPLPHGQPKAVSSLRTEDSSRLAEGSQPLDLASPPAATSTQAERSSGEEPHRTAKRVAFSEQGSSGSHVTGSTPSPEIPLQPPLSAAGVAWRPLTDEEEAQLGEREQSELVRRPLHPDLPCFAMWVDSSYYPGRLVSESRAGRWLVKFDDGTERQVPAGQVLPVAALWSGLSVFVQSSREMYEAAIITGHRMTTGSDALEYIVSVDSRPNVTSAVPRSRLLLTRDQAALIMERRRSALGQLVVGSPTRDLSLDNLVTGRRRRTADTAAGRRLANFETSCSDTGDRAESTARRAGSTPATPRRKGSRAKSQASGKKGKTPEAKEKTSPTGRGSCQTPEAKEKTPPTGRGSGRAAPPLPSTGTVAPASSASAGGSSATPDRPAPGGQSPAATPRSRRGSRAKSARTPAAAAAATAADDAAATAATPGGRRRKRITASTPTDEDATAVAAATPSGRGRRQASAPAQEAAATPVTPTARGRKRPALSSSTSPEGAATAATPRGRSRRRLATTPTPEEQAVPAAAERAPHASHAPVVTAGHRSRHSARTSATTTDSSSDDVQMTASLGDYPEDKTSLFQNHTFILTCINTEAAPAPPGKWKRKLTAPFDKQHVTRHIELRGGQVLLEPTLNAAAVQRVRRHGDLLLISNGPLRTAKYISCLAMSVPCLQLRWLEDSVALNQCLPYEDYLLPAGQDALTGKTVDQLLSAPPPMAGLKALVAAAPDSDWGQTMAHILAAAGAEVKLDNQDPAEAELPFPAAVVVAEPDCPPAVLDWAGQLHVPLVSGEWVIGSVVAHRQLDCAARPEFSFSAQPAADAR